MTEEFNLSKKRIHVDIGEGYYEEDVKEFIKLIKEGYQKIHPDRLHLDVIPMIDKLAGDESK